MAEVGAARLVVTGAPRWLGSAATVAAVVVVEGAVVERPVAACAFSNFFAFFYFK